MKKTLLYIAVLGVFAFGTVAHATVSSDSLATRNQYLDQILSTLINKVSTLSAENANLKSENASLRAQLAQVGVNVPASAVQNTTPTVAQPDPVVTPTEVKFDAPFAWMLMSPNPNDVTLNIYRANGNANVTVTVDGKTSSYVVPTSSTANKPWYTTVATGLTPNTTYNYTVRLDQNGQYAVQSGTFTTLSQ